MRLGPCLPPRPLSPAPPCRQIRYPDTPLPADLAAYFGSIDGLTLRWALAGTDRPPRPPSPRVPATTATVTATSPPHYVSSARKLGLGLAQISADGRRGQSSDLRTEIPPPRMHPSTSGKPMGHLFFPALKDLSTYTLPDTVWLMHGRKRES
jgi:hypothetical protein